MARGWRRDGEGRETCYSEGKETGLCNWETRRVNEIHRI